MIDVPYFDKLAASKTFEKIKTTVHFYEYLPEIDVLSRPLNRKYLFNVSADHFEPVHNQPLPI